MAINSPEQQLEGIQDELGTDSRGRFSLTATELLAILAFWTVLALITALGRRLDPRVELDAKIASAVVTLSFIEYAIWAVLTVPIVWLSSRFSVEGGHRWIRIFFFIALGIVLAIAVDQVIAMARSNLLPLPPNRRFGGRGGPSSGWMRLSRLEFLDDLMVYFAVLGAGIARDYFVRYRLRLEEATRLQAHAAQLQAQLATAQLAALRNQLNPHFLFNTLHAVSALVERDPRGVRKMISRLSDLLRHTLEGSHKQETPLEDELDLIRRYVEIMEVRFQGKLDVETELDEGMRRALVPSLLLQPIVENAIKHGVGDRTDSAMIKINVHKEADQLVIRVSDNGPGVSGNASPAETGVGLSNTRARLKQLYGDAQSFTLTNSSGGGAVAEIRLPFRLAAYANAEASA
jgi:two-component system LytT family sensor kinase